MPKRSSKRKDTNVIAAFVVQTATDTSTIKNPSAVALGRLGGKKGGKARAQKLTPQQRSEIARKAAKTRWSKT
jgi:hypothetical protein